MLFRREDNEDRNEHIDMTPMVDVVFQLMTFMLVLVQMTGGEKVDVPGPAWNRGRRDGRDVFELTKPSGSTMRRRCFKKDPR